MGSILALAAGYHLSSLLTVLIVHFFSVPAWVVMLFIAGFALTGFLVFHIRLRRELTQFQLPRAGIKLLPLGILLAVILLFLFFVLQPYSQAGKFSAGGARYNDFFSTVFFKHLSITTELSRDEIPPQNPFFVGTKLNYYWLFHVFPSVVHSSLNIPLEETLFLLTWIVSLITLFAIMILIHAFSTRTTDLILGVTPLLFAYSYDGAFVLAKLRQLAMPWSDFTSMNIDAAARVHFSSSEVIGIYRAFVFDPHHMFAICLMVVSFLLFRRVLNSPSRIVAGAALFLLGGIAGHSAFIAYTAISWIGLWLLIELLRGQASFLREPRFLIVASLIVLFYAILYFKFPGFFEIGKSDLRIRMVTQSNLFLLIDFGAAVAIGGLGLFLGIKKKDWRILPLAILLMVGFGQLFFVYFPAWPHDLSMKTGHSVYIALACLGAHFFSKQASGSIRRKLAILAFAALSLPALPTLIMDWYSLQQTENVETTTLVTHDDLKACEWINENLPKDSIVQPIPSRSGNAFYSLIPTFAQRRTVLGDPMHSRIFQGDLERIRNRRMMVNLLFLTSSAEVSWLVARNLGIDYIYIGTSEGKPFRDKQAKFRDLKYFQKIYSGREVRIFQVLPENTAATGLMDSYDEQIDTSIVSAELENGFAQMKDPGVWSPSQWRGRSGAVLSLSTPKRFTGVLLFHMYVLESATLEVLAEKAHGPIKVEPGWRWIELDEVALEKGRNRLRFKLEMNNPQVFQISEIIFFGRAISNGSNDPTVKYLSSR